MSRWNIIENIAAEIGNLISSIIAISRNIEKIPMTELLGIT